MTRETIYITERERAVLVVFIRDKILKDEIIINELNALIEKIKAQNAFIQR